MAPISLDPVQRIVDLSFGNRIAIIYANAGRPNSVIPPQVALSIGLPVALTLINSDAILPPIGIGSSNPPIGPDVTAEMLQAYRAWRYQSAGVYSAGHAELIGIQSAVALNLAKFTGPRVAIALSAVGMGANFSPAGVAVSTYRGLRGVTFPDEGSGTIFSDAPPVSIKTARRFTPGPLTGSINLETLAVTLVGESTSGGGGGSQG